MLQEGSFVINGGEQINPPPLEQGELLLSTKLFIPSLRADRVSRPRLFESMDCGLEKALILVSAPPGYGKTTSVSSWLHEIEVPSTWISLDEGDNDPVRFLQYLIFALQKIIPTLQLDLSGILQGMQQATFKPLLNILINEIAGRAAPFVLVLDDFHTIHAQAILEIVIYLLEHVPPQMHVALLSRTDPPLPLSQLRARNQLLDIRADHLRFTRDEITCFLNEFAGLDLSAAEIEAMERRTEGWIAGLQLAALSMQGCKDVHGFITAFSGSHHYIVDYLADEVLLRQDEQIRLFLLQTSILSRMCASLCNSLVEVRALDRPLDGQKILETLEKMNLFIIPLDEERRWYRYHHLFADALSRRLEYQYPELLPKLYRRASEWYEGNGLIADTIQYALRAGDRERVAQLVEEKGCYLLMSGEVLTLLKWLEAVEDYFQQHPWLVIQKGWALTLARRMEPAEQAFQTAERLVSRLEPTPDVNTMVGTISAGRAYWADIRGNILEAARLAGQALDLLPDTDPLSQSMRSVATGALAKTRWMMGDLDQARQIYDQAVEIGQAANNIEMVVNTNDAIAEILIEQGHLKQAEQLLLEILPMTNRPDGQRLPLAAQVYFELSKVYYEWNQLDQAAHFTHKCLDVSQQWGNLDMQAAGSVMLARIGQAHRYLEKAQLLMRTAEQLNRDHRLYPRNSKWVEASLERFWLSQGSLERVSQRIQDSGIHPTDEITYLQEFQYLTLLRWLLACRDYEGALDLAERMLQIAKDEHRMGRVVELLVLQSLAYQGKKDTSVAVTTLAQAVSLAQPEGYQRVFLDDGELVAKLLYLVKSNQDTAGYASELLEAFGPVSGRVAAPAQFLIEPLSAREIEVLKLIEAGLSNQEIAAKLFISIPTVKRHISNIYAKLGVKTRTQAVARGKELGFFDG